MGTEEGALGPQRTDCLQGILGGRGERGGSIQVCCGDTVVRRLTQSTHNKLEGSSPDLQGVHGG